MRWSGRRCRDTTPRVLEVAWVGQPLDCSTSPSATRAASVRRFSIGGIRARRRLALVRQFLARGARSRSTWHGPPRLLTIRRRCSRSRVFADRLQHRRALALSRRSSSRELSAINPVRRSMRRASLDPTTCRPPLRQPDPLLNTARISNERCSYSSSTVLQSIVPGSVRPESRGRSHEPACFHAVRATGREDPSRPPRARRQRAIRGDLDNGLRVSSVSRNSAWTARPIYERWIASNARFDPRLRLMSSYDPIGARGTPFGPTARLATVTRSFMPGRPSHCPTDPRS